MPLSATRSERLALLRAEVHAIERTDARRKAAALPFGLDPLDAHLADGGIAHAALHEACGEVGGLSHHAAATLFLAGIAARIAGPVLWVLRRRDLFAPALQNAGLGPDRLIYAEAGHEADVLAVMEDALRHGALGAVIGETARAGLTVTRRLQLAAEEGGTTALLLRTPRRGGEDPLAEPSSAVTRWRVGCAPSDTSPETSHAAVLGRPRWRLALARQRGGSRGNGWWRQMMMRVASLYLPDFAIERIRRADARADRAPPAGMPPEPPPHDFPPAPMVADVTSGWRPGARWARGGPEASPPATIVPLTVSPATSPHAGPDVTDTGGPISSPAASSATVPNGAAVAGAERITRARATGTACETRSTMATDVTVNGRRVARGASGDPTTSRPAAVAWPPAPSPAAPSAASRNAVVPAVTSRIARTPATGAQSGLLPHEASPATPAEDVIVGCPPDTCLSIGDPASPQPATVATPSLGRATSRPATSRAATARGRVPAPATASAASPDAVARIGPAPSAYHARPAPPADGTTDPGDALRSGSDEAGASATAGVVARDRHRLRRDDPSLVPRDAASHGDGHGDRAIGQPRHPVSATPRETTAAVALHPTDAWLHRDAARKAKLAAEVATLPAHQRPPPREFGRCDQAAAVPFRAMPSDEAGGRAVPDPPPSRAGTPPAPRPNGYMPDAFWHSRRELGASVARAVGGVTRASLPDRAAPQPPPLTPLVTALRDGARIVVAAACPHARAAGIAPGMAVTLARAMLPTLDVRPADHAGDAAALAKLAVHAARRWSPIVAVDDSAGDGAPPDGLWIDMSAAPLFGGERAMCRRILRWLARRGYDARIAVAGTCGAAHALARHGDGALLRCLPGREADAIALLPPAALRLPPRTVSVLARLGVTDIGMLAAMPRGPLARRFGAGLVRRIDQALGHAAEPLDAVVPPETPHAGVRLVEPIATAEPIAQVIDDLCAALAADLRARGLGARRVALVCRRVDGRDVAQTIGTARATRDAGHLARLLRARIERIDPGFGIEAARLIAFHAEPLAARPIGGGDLVAPAPDLAELVDLIAGRIGTRGLYRLGARESDVPERSLTALGPLGDAPPRHPRWPRPIRLIDPPERVDHVIAELPDAPPKRFAWRGRTYRLSGGDGPERIYGEWWRRDAEADAVRDYYRVEADDGQRFWLFRRGDGVDPRTGDFSWHVQGLFG